MFRLFAAAVVLALTAAVALTDDKKTDPITEIPTDKADKIETTDGSVAKPTHVTSTAELEKLVKDETTRKRLANLADFKTHTLLVFAWQGSGKDKLEYAILESHPEQIEFAFEPGMTDDLRDHVRLYLLRKDVTKWSVK